jgi:hypothetical protein
MIPSQILPNQEVVAETAAVGNASSIVMVEAMTAAPATLRVGNR